MMGGGVDDRIVSYIYSPFHSRLDNVPLFMSLPPPSPPPTSLPLQGWWSQEKEDEARAGYRFPLHSLSHHHVALLQLHAHPTTSPPLVTPPPPPSTPQDCNFEGAERCGGSQKAQRELHGVTKHRKRSAACC